MSGSVAVLREVCQVLERYVSYWRGVMVIGGCRGMWEGVITFRRCDSPQGGVTDVKKVCQLMERCDAQMGGVKECEEV